MPPLAPLLQRLPWRRLADTFLAGLFAILPILVTLALVTWVIGAADAMLGGFIRFLLPSGLYVPGMGLVLSLLLIFGVGLLMQAVVVRQYLRWFEEQLERLPLIKTVYGAVRDLTGLFSRGSDNRRFGQVVMVQLPGMPLRLIGFVTVTDLPAAGLPLPAEEAGQSVAVYLPMSYQIGGYTVFLPRQYLTPLDMSFEEAMRFLITAGLSRPDEAPPAP